MGWAVATGLALGAFAMLAWVLHAPRRGWEAIGAALLVGLAGFALQASPDQAGAPKASAERAQVSGEALVDARRQLASGGAVASNQWMVFADAFARRGQFGDAATVVLGAIEKDPNNAEAWLALGNNLVAHAEGNLTPAARYAFEQAARADPRHPGPPFFLGLALAQSGNLAEGRAMWADLLARTPPDAPWRADLVERLARLDAFIAAQRDSGGN